MFSHPILLIFLFVISIKLVGVVGRAPEFSTTIKGSEKYQQIAFIINNTDPEDYVAVFGSDTWLLVASDRKAASRITYLFPEIKNFPIAQHEFVSGIRKKNPKYIVESKCTYTINNVLRTYSCDQSSLFQNLEFSIKENYRHEKDIGSLSFWARSK